MARMFWQRCPRCGRLTLTRLGAATVCDCAQEIPAPPARPLFGPTPDAQAITPAPAALPAPPAPAPDAAQTPALALLTPAQDANVRRLLASVFPNGVDL